MDKPWKVVLAFVGVFIAGAIFGGALAPRWLGHGHFLQSRAPFGGPRMIDRLSADLALSAEQKEKIVPIVERAETETRRLRRESVQSFRAVIDRMNAEISPELTPEQRVKLEELRKRFRERIERFRSEFHDREHRSTPTPSAPASP